MDNQGCLSVETFPIGQSLGAYCFRIGETASVSGFGISKPLEVSCFRVCSINSESFVRFKESMLSWYGADNTEGVIKYNILTASHSWSLEEVEIEELL